MIYIIKTQNEWGEEKGVFSVTTSRKKMTSLVRKYMRKLKIEFSDSHEISDIEDMEIDELNRCLQNCNTKGKDCMESWNLRIELWQNGEYDQSYLGE